MHIDDFSLNRLKLSEVTNTVLENVDIEKEGEEIAHEDRKNELSANGLSRRQLLKAAGVATIAVSTGALATAPGTVKTAKASTNKPKLKGPIGPKPYNVLFILTDQERYFDPATLPSGYSLPGRQRMRNEGISFVKGKVAGITEDDGSGGLILEVEDTIAGEKPSPQFDMVVLATGVVPNGADGPVPITVGYDEYGFLDGATDVEGDVHFPKWNSPEWRITSEERFDADEQNDHMHVFQIIQRANSPID